MQPGTCDIGLIGLAVMGQNLVLNMNDHGYKVAVFNRTVSKVDEFIGHEATGTQVVGAHSIEELVSLLKKPAARHADGQGRRDRRSHDRHHRCLILKRATSSSMAAIRYITDSNRRTKSLAEKGILFIGTGVSGGEEGARNGPSIMPGGNPAAWPHVKEIFQGIAAKVDDGTPCCDWVGENGAGHYVKMVHNGIEYGDMQLICEAYQLLKDGLGLNADRTARGVRRLEQGRARQLSDRDHARHLRATAMKTACRWSTRFSIRPGRRARESGRSSAPSNWVCPSR